MHYITIKLANLCAKVANEISEKDMEKSFKIIDKINKDSRRRAGYSSHISNEANKHYIYRMYGKAKDKGD